MSLSPFSRKSRATSRLLITGTSSEPLFVSTALSQKLASCQCCCKTRPCLPRPRCPSASCTRFLPVDLPAPWTSPSISHARRPKPIPTHRRRQPRSRRKFRFSTSWLHAACPQHPPKGPPSPHSPASMLFQPQPSSHHLGRRPAWPSFPPPPPVGKERTSVVSTPFVAKLYRFAMNFLLVSTRNQEEEQGRQEETEVKGEGQSEETAHIDDYVDGVKCKTPT